MKWCLECHRNPEPNLRPPEQIFNMTYARGANDPSGAALAQQYQIRSPQQLTECSLCHY
jgi:hypothetical protein